MKKTMTIEESLIKIKYMMEYNYGSPNVINEQNTEVDTEVDTETSGIPDYTPNDNNIGHATRVLKRNFARIDKWIKWGNVKKMPDGTPAIDALKAKYKELTGTDLPNVTSSSGTAGTGTQKGGKTGGYTPVDGTTTPYRQGTMGTGIGQLQQAFGFTGADLDNKWGPNTQKKISELVPEYSNGFTNSNLPNILQKITTTSTPVNKAATTAPVTGQTPPTSLGQAPSTTQLAGEMGKTQQADQQRRTAAATKNAQPYA